MNTRLTDDLAYVREIAESGASAPLLGGRFLAWWGLLATGAYLGHYAIIKGAAGLTPAALPVLWIGFTVLGLGGYFLLTRFFPANKPGASSAGNRASEYAWMASGFVLFSFFTGVTIKSMLTGAASSGYSWSIPLVLGVYGISQLVSGLMSSTRWLVLAGYAAIAFVGLTSIITDRAELYLAAALAAGITVFLPGLMMLRDEPSTTL